ncbi:MAG TPA: DUF5362 family protein [Paludibacteraceae bacterium]|nr:DUF5362 family protein [Paludibacteraceae bacterium]
MEANKLVVTENCKKDLLITAKWSRIYAIISIFSVAILLVVGIVLLVSSFFIDNQQIGLDKEMLAPAGVMYILLGLLLIIPTMYLLQFGQNTKKAVAEDNLELMELAINRMKSYWKFMGVFTLVVIVGTLSLVLIGFLIA